MTKNVLPHLSQSDFADMKEHTMPFWAGTTRILFSWISDRIGQRIGALTSQLFFGSHNGAIHPYYHPNNSTFRERNPQSVEALRCEVEKIFQSDKDVAPATQFENKEQTRRIAFLTDRQSIQPTKTTSLVSHVKFLRKNRLTERVLGE